MRVTHTLPAILLVLTISLTAPVMAADCARTVSTLGMGPSEGVAVVGHLAIIGVGPAVVTYDITDPGHPRRMGEAEFGGTTVPVGTLGNLVLAFVTSSSPARLVVIDPNPQGSPLEIASVALPEQTRPDDLVVVDSTAWIATWSSENGLLAVDLSDPHTPAVVQILELPGAAESITALDDTILIVSRNVGLTVVDVSDPDEPSFIGSLEILDAAAITASAEYAYVATARNSRDSTIVVVDITDLAHPVTVSSVPVSYLASPTDLAIVDDRLYFGLWDWDPSIGLPEGGFVLYDIGDPVVPVEIDYAPFSSGPQRFVPTGTTIVATDHERGLRIFTETAGELTEIARRNPTLDDAFSIAVEGDIAYLGDQGLRLIDISDHSHPAEMGSVELEGNIHAVAVDGDGARAASLAWGGELTLIDTSNPSQPIARWSGQTDGVDVSMSDSIVAVAEGDLGVALIDATDLVSPVLLARIVTANRALSVALDSGIAVVGLAASGAAEGAVAIYDIADPANPTLTARFPTSDWVRAVDAAGSKAAILSGESILMIDYSDPTAPVEIGALNARTGIAEDLALDGFIAHVSSWSGSLHVIDFSEPGEPSLKARTTWDPFGIADGGPQGGYGVAIHDGAAVIADGRYGLRVVSVGRCRPAPGPERGRAAID